MIMTTDAIRKKAVDEEAFQKGSSLFAERKAAITKDESFWKGEREIRAHVEEDGSTFHTVLFFKHKKLFEYSCSCGEYRGLCRHLVASALEYKKQDGTEAKRVLTSPAVYSMLEDYEKNRRVSMLTSVQEEKVELSPVLSLYQESLFAGFLVGGKKKYVVKDLESFCSQVKGELWGSYGKNLQFYHTAEAFAVESRPLLSFLMEAFELEMKKRDSLPSYKRKERMRRLPLAEYNIDRFFALVSGKEIPLEDERGEEHSLLIRKEDPEMTVEVIRTGNNGFCFRLPEKFQLFTGKGLYLYWDHTIWICSEAYKRDMLPFLKTACRDGLLDKEGQIELSREDMPLFCQRVLPVLKKRTRLIGEPEENYQFPVTPLKNRFYFDREEGNILLRVEHSYGEEKFSALKRDSVSYPYRDEAGEELAGLLVTRYFDYRSEEQDCFVQKEEEEKLFLLLKEGISQFQQAGEVFLSESFRKWKLVRPKQPAAKVSVSGGWFTLSVDLGGLSQEELSRMLSAYRKKKRYFRLENGGFGETDKDSARFLEYLEKGLGISEKDLSHPLLLSQSKAWYLDWLLEETPYVETKGREELSQMLRAFSEKKQISLPQNFTGELRTYQKEGFYWLYALESHGFGGLLADEMGLGKTIQIIALLAKRKEEGNGCLTSLVVCPASLVYNWEQEIRRFAPKLSVLPMAGDQAERRALLKKAAQFDVVITSYDLLKRDEERYKGLSFEMEIIDEAQYIKNASTQNARAVKHIRAKSRFALTGTPVENRLSELWSIFDYLMPGYLKTYAFFRDQYEYPISKGEDEEAQIRLKKLIAPFLLRRLKRDVLKELPPRLETIVYSGLTGEQEKLYKAHALDLRQKVENGGFAKDTVELLAGLTRLRQLCCDPRLYYEDYRGESAKFETCMELVQSGIMGGHRILIFSQFTSMLELIGEELSRKGITYFSLTGKTSKKKRMELVTRFQNREASVFLISLKAGGTGLNLTAADMVIHYDPWWNVAAQNQATDRVHRMGQENPVSVFKLIVRHTIEENIVTLQEAKRDLAARIMGTGQWSLGQLSKDQLLHLLDWSE